MSAQIITPTAQGQLPAEWFDDDSELSDDEMYELEMRISRDHDDAAYWQGGAR